MKNNLSITQLNRLKRQFRLEGFPFLQKLIGLSFFLFIMVRNFDLKCQTCTVASLSCNDQDPQCVLDRIDSQECSRRINQDSQTITLIFKKKNHGTLFHNKRASYSFLSSCYSSFPSSFSLMIDSLSILPQSINKYEF